MRANTTDTIQKCKQKTKFCQVCVLGPIKKTPQIQAPMAFPLMIPSLPLVLNREVFAYYGCIEHQFFFNDDERVIDAVVLLVQSGVHISGNTVLLWGTQENKTPFEKLLKECPRQMWTILCSTQVSQSLVQIPPRLIAQIKDLEKRERPLRNKSMRM